MELEVEALTSAGYAERSLERTNQRNGYRERRWETRAGTVLLKIPKLRKGSYLPAYLNNVVEADHGKLNQASAPARARL